VSAGLTASPRVVHPGPDGDRCCAGEAHRALDWPSSRGLATASHCPSSSRQTGLRNSEAVHSLRKDRPAKRLPRLLRHCAEAQAGQTSAWP
jgi:hypothetical protein